MRARKSETCGWGEDSVRLKALLPLLPPLMMISQLINLTLSHSDSINKAEKKKGEKSACGREGRGVEGRWGGREREKSPLAAVINALLFKQ